MVVPVSANPRVSFMSQRAVWVGGEHDLGGLGEKEILDILLT